MYGRNYFCILQRRKPWGFKNFDRKGGTREIEIFSNFKGYIVLMRVITLNIVTIYFNLRQLLASVMIPGFTINRICWTVGKGIKLAKFKHPMGKWIPTIVGLLSIPLIIHPIDKGKIYSALYFV